MMEIYERIDSFARGKIYLTLYKIYVNMYNEAVNAVEDNSAPGF